MNPEDLTAVGVKKPGHRKRLREEISKLRISDGIPDFIPEHLQEWLNLLRLGDYLPRLTAQEYFNLEKVANINIEDLEDAGFVKLGHQKRLILAIKKLKELRRNETIIRRKQTLSLKDFSTFRQPISDNIITNEQKEDSSKLLSSQKSSSLLSERKIFCYYEGINRLTKENTFWKPPFPENNQRNFEVKENKQQLNSQSLGSQFNNNYKSNTLPRFKHISNNKYRPVATVRANTRTTATDVIEDNSEIKDNINNLTPAHNTNLVKSSSMSKLSTKSTSNRTGGDVFDDIGTMLSDLTNELDEMIKSEEEQEGHHSQMFHLDKDRRLEKSFSLNDGEGLTFM